MDCPVRQERSGLVENKTMSGSAIDEPPGSEQARQKERYQEAKVAREEENKKTLFPCGKSALKVSVAEERCGKCDHGFNLKLSGVNKEYVAGRHRGQDYWALLCCGSFPPLLRKRRKKKTPKEWETLNCLTPAGRRISRQKYIDSVYNTASESWWKLVS